jgi:hypothetical protein
MKNAKYKSIGIKKEPSLQERLFIKYFQLIYASAGITET